jgi:transcription elongation factor GreA
MYDELTAVDIRKMQEELEYIHTVLLPQLGAEVKRTREYGDLSENAEYKVAKQERNRARSRARYLEAMIRTARVIEVKTVEGEVSLFDYVTYFHEGRGITKRVQIVTTLRQDALEGYLSKESPLGQALLGKREGDRVEVVVNPTRSYFVTIQKIEKGEDNESLPIAPF